MKFGRIDIDQAEGAILAHSLQAKGGILKKGRVLSAADIDALRAAGHESVVAARLGEDDVPEDDAAAVVARAIAGTCVRVAEPFTGRCNLYAEVAGIVTIDACVLTRINRIDEALTIATVMPFDRVTAGQMLATVKVIPFAAPEPTVAKAVALAEGGLVSVAPFKAKRVGLVLTTLPNTKASVLAKRERVMADRLAALGSELTSVLRVAHDPEAVRGGIEALKGAGLDPILVFAASAIVDRNDVIPAAVAAAGGQILHLGMPVDPGNLLMLGRIGRTDVVGVPSCAGSPKLNGFDWVLERRLAGLSVGREEIAGMGVGGLLKEIATRPQPRDLEDDSARREKRIGIIVLAAGRSSRMGTRNKLTEEIDGKPIVHRVVQAALESRARPIVVVTGHQADDVKSRLNGLDVKVVHNPDYAEGMSTSLRAGISALPKGLDGAIVALGDMPEVQAAHLDRLIAAFEPKEGRSIVVPVFHGRRGNPVLWGAEHFPAMMAVEGDVGARQVLAENAESIVEVDLKSNAVLIDVDTPEALAAVRQGRLQG
jgi:molybdenum cofactor cytidylyltransferase